MMVRSKSIDSLALGLLTALALLGWPRVGFAQGTWSVVPLPQPPGQESTPRALAADGAGNLYVGWVNGSNLIQRRDAQADWSVIAIFGTDPGQVGTPPSLALDAAGDLYVADGGAGGNNGRIQMRDAQGNWSVLAATGSALGQVNRPTAVVVDAEGNLFVADGDEASSRVQERDTHGNWSAVAMAGTSLGQVDGPSALAVDGAGNLYVADAPYEPTLAKYVGRVRKRDAQGSWSVLAAGGSGPGQVDLSYGGALAVDGAGNLYVADTGNNRVQMYTPGP